MHALSRSSLGFLAACAFACDGNRAQAVPFFPQDPSLQAVPYLTGAVSPTGFAFLPAPPGTAPELFVLEKASGRVLHARAGSLLGTALDLAVNSNGERGLLGIALHPQFMTNGYVYLYYTASSTPIDETATALVLENRVARYTWNGSALIAPVILLRFAVDPAFAFHQGGKLLFGPDRMLYGVVGDGGRNGQLQNNPNGPGPDDTSVVFRIRDDGTSPTDNPFFALGGAMRKVFAYGVRNSFGLGFDPVSGALWDTENGPAHYDEVNRVARGFNSGWVQLMGPDERDPASVSDLWLPAGAAYSDPIFSWLSPVAVTAVHFVRDGTLGPVLQGDCLVGAFNTRSIYRFGLDPGRTTFTMPTPEVADRVADSSMERDLFLWAAGFDGGIVDMNSGPDGAFYVLVYESGTLYRIVDPTDAPDVVSGFGARLTVFPNPFATAVRLSTTRTAGTPATPLASGTIAIYSVDGRLVRCLAVSSGETVWDGRDGRARDVGAGTYYACSPGWRAAVIHRLPRR
jgi:glucose/arabinose dehydrogenase